MTAEAKQEKHKPGSLKQQNKAHKTGQHRTKGQLDAANKGQVGVKVISRQKKVLNKQQRRNQAKQMRTEKRQAVVGQRRGIASNSMTVPHIVAVVPIGTVWQSREIVQNLIASDDSIECTHDEYSTSIHSTRHKHRFTLLTPKQGDLLAILDAAKVADTVLFVSPASYASGTDGIDKFSENLLTCLVAQGLPSSAHAVPGLQGALPAKKHGDAKKAISKRLQKWFTDAKFHSVDTPQECGVLLRHIFGQKRKSVFYRSKRPYILAREVEFVAGDDAVDSTGVLKVTGYVRGRALCVNRLVHLPGLGDFQMKQIDAAREPYAAKRRFNGSVEMEEEAEVIAKADPSKQDSLVAEAEVDPMEGEQTWPTDEELKAADEEAAVTLQLRRGKAKAGGDYQAAWIMEDDDDEDEDDDDDDEWEDCDSDGDENMGIMTAVDDDDEEADDDEEFDAVSTVTESVANDERYDDMVDDIEEQRQLAKWEAEREDAQFPDEIDTPQDVVARERFQRYRGLKSFRTSPWDPRENLPLDYARIFQFQNFEHAKNRALKVRGDEEADAATVGAYVTVYIDNVPRSFTDARAGPLVVSGLLQHEHKMTMMHYVVRKHPSCTVPVQSKESLVFHVGHRRFTASPILSQHTTGDKFKQERFLPHDDACVMSVYAPATFPTAPVLVFTTDDYQLAATGSVLKSDPNRIVAKKIVLSGHPFKINKRSVVVRYMFFNREDILWFKPVELTTKYGRRGHIKEPLGTRGHMKCVFDGQVNAQDTICMSLYKRIFPRWDYSAVHCPSPPVVPIVGALQPVVEEMEDDS